MRPAHALIATVCAAALAAAPALALDLPKRKSGLWELSTSREGAAKPAAAATMQMCIDEKLDDLSRQMGESAAKDMCSKRDIRREGDAIVADSVCKLGETTATSHTVMTGRFDSAYQVDVRTKFTPPMMGMSESVSTIKARWVGPCAAGQRPGDVMLPNGTRMNLYDAEKAAAKK